MGRCHVTNRRGWSGLRQGSEWHSWEGVAKLGGCWRKLRRNWKKRSGFNYVVSDTQVLPRNSDIIAYTMKGHGRRSFCSTRTCSPRRVPALWGSVSAACIGTVSLIQVEQVGEERGGKMRGMLLTLTGNKDSNWENDKGSRNKRAVGGVLQGYHPWTGSKRARRLTCGDYFKVSSFWEGGRHYRRRASSMENFWSFMENAKEMYWVLYKWKDRNATVKKNMSAEVYLLESEKLNYPLQNWM